MGLMKTNYNVPAMGITLNCAYAKVTALTIDSLGNAKAVLSVQKDRNSVDSFLPMSQIEVNFITDKTGNVFEEAYSAAKTGIFSDWNDDIVTQEGVLDDFSL